jgi:hypothetical protein
MNPGEETTGRIRWEPTKYGGWTGHVGTIKQFVFQVWKPAEDKPWQLESNLPGHFGHISTSADPDKLKRRAEDWLSGFVSSLGAVFPESSPQGDLGEYWLTRETTTKCPRDDCGEESSGLTSVGYALAWVKAHQGFHRERDREAATTAAGED